jgi:hypothetical protein
VKKKQINHNEPFINILLVSVTKKSLYEIADAQFLFGGQIFKKIFV